MDRTEKQLRAISLAKETSLSNETLFKATNSAYQNHMMKSYVQILAKAIPDIDQFDVAANLLDQKGKNRQFAPEYSQQVYWQMRREEVRIGDYTTSDRVSNSVRVSILHLIEKLAELKDYKIETLFLAVSLFDMYTTTAKPENRITCLGSLAVSCLLIAAKLEEPITPNYNNMCRLLGKLGIVQIEKSALSDIESKVLVALDFSIRSIISINFLDRYLRLFGLDQGKISSAQV